jgi:hypothetical protein
MYVGKDTFVPVNGCILKKISAKLTDLAMADLEKARLQAKIRIHDSIHRSTNLGSKQPAALGTTGIFIFPLARVYGENLYCLARRRSMIERLERPCSRPGPFSPTVASDFSSTE